MEGVGLMGGNPTKSIFALDSDTEENIGEADSHPGAIATHETSSIREEQSDSAEDLNDNVPSADDTRPENSARQASTPEENRTDLTAFQRAKIERNRQRALLLRQARLQAHPYRNGEGSSEHSVIRVQNSRLIDSGGGFLIEEKDLQDEQSKEVVITEDPAPIIVTDRPHCIECEHPLHDSYLYRSFSYPVCDGCRDDEDKHMLITRTDARQEYLLKECDLDLREPILRFVLRKNPHNPRWGDMKLYLRLQVEKRALEVWESLEKIEEERELRDSKREKAKVKKFNKQVKALRMAVRSSVYTKQTAGHEHSFGAENYDEERDIYFRKCNTCPFQREYEKM